MGKAEALVEVGKLVSNYGLDNISEERIESYVDNLLDIDPLLLSEAVKEIIRKSKFFPAVSEIRAAAAHVAGLPPLLPAAAMEVIRQADVRRPVYRRDGSFAYEERVWEWPEMNAATKEAVQSALSKAGEPCDETGKTHFGWDTGFQKLYEAEAEQVSARLLTDLSQARLPEPKPTKILPMPKADEPRPDETPIQQCVKCQKHIGVFDTPDGPLCFFCHSAEERK